MRSLIAVSATLLLLIAALWMFVQEPSGIPGGGEPLVVYCAAGVAPEVSQLALAYEKLFHQPVRLELGGSGTLLSRLRVRAFGDLYIAGDVSYLNRARESGVVREILPVALLRPVIAVARGNPLQIRVLEDLRRPDVKYTLASPEAAAVGRLLRDAMKSKGKWAALSGGAHTFKPTVEDVANDVALGVVDAGVVWGPVAARHENLDAIPLTLTGNPQHLVSVGVLESSAQSSAALRFARFLASSDKGQPVFHEAGYDLCGGDVFVSEQPELLLFCGAMLRVGVERQIRAFEKREGVRVNRVYNGCGILVSQMDAGARPDAYITCDESFMSKVQSLFQTERNLTTNDIVIAVKKGNPLGIKSLDDLGSSGVKLGLGHPTQSALGALTKRLIGTLDSEDAILRNNVLESPTGDLLVSQLRVGHLDAIIVYRSNVLSNPSNMDDLGIVSIPLPGALASQTFAASISTSQSLLVERLLSSIADESSRGPLEKLGFRYIGPSK